MRDPEGMADLALAFWDRFEILEAKVASLERNSRSSSKPPSSDKGNFSNPPKPKPKSLRRKSGKKPGGQKGHPGDTLQQTKTPDHIEEHRLSAESRCPACGAIHSPKTPEKALAREACVCRQVYDLPPIEIEVTEHRAEKACCQDCGNIFSAAFPPEADSHVQYGPRLQGAALYLGSYQMIPYQRLAETFREIFHCSLSQGTLANIVRRGGKRARLAMQPIRQALLQAKTAHADETGCSVENQRQWLHVFSTAKLTAFHLDAKRGAEAMERAGLIPNFRGNLVHDGLGAYHSFRNCAHFFCNAHLQRELVYLHEEMDQKWAGDMITLLLEAKKLAAREANRKEASRHVIGEKTIKRIMAKYSDIIIAGHAVNPEPPPPPPGKRGRVKRGKALNLLKRFDENALEIMGFFVDGNIPYDNNQAERDLRMMKVREKISGTYRSGEYGQANWKRAKESKEAARPKAA